MRLAGDNTVILGCYLVAEVLITRSGEVSMKNINKRRRSHTSYLLSLIDPSLAISLLFQFAISTQNERSRDSRYLIMSTMTRTNKVCAFRLRSGHTFPYVGGDASCPTSPKPAYMLPFPPCTLRGPLVPYWVWTT